MFSRSELAQFSEVCKSIGNAVADESGFVSIRNLLSRFHAKLLIRPLLVEGMLVSLADEGVNKFSASQWAVLVDSETYNVSERDVALEDKNKPLPTRLRNTIAHELVHSLAFRPSEFGIRLLKNFKKNELSIKANELVKNIEEHTEKFSPLLLWPETSLKKFLADKKQPLSIEDLVRARKSMGISRQILITRLNLIPLDDDDRYQESLRNIAIGLGEWGSGGKAILRSWPIFLNFERNLIPLFLITLKNQDQLSAEVIFSDSEFSMCGGVRNSIELEVDARTFDSSTTRKIKVRCLVEGTKKTKGSNFIYLVQKLGD